MISLAKQWRAALCITATLVSSRLIYRHNASENNIPHNLIKLQLQHLAYFLDFNLKTSGGLWARRLHQGECTFSWTRWRSGPLTLLATLLHLQHEALSL